MSTVALTPRTNAGRTVRGLARKLNSDTLMINGSLLLGHAVSITGAMWLFGHDAHSLGLALFVGGVLGLATGMFFAIPIFILIAVPLEMFFTGPGKRAWKRMRPKSSPVRQAYLAWEAEERAKRDAAAQRAVDQAEHQVRQEAEALFMAYGMNPLAAAIAAHELIEDSRAKVYRSDQGKIA